MRPSHLSLFILQPTYYDDIDYYDRVNHLGIYKDPEPEPDPEDDIYLHGLDPDELGNMSEERRREAIRDAGLDPDDYDDDMFSGHSGGGRSAGTHRSSSTNQSSKQNIVVKFLDFKYSGQLERECKCVC